MKCSNVKCARTVDQPLELYNGSWVCPHCKKPINAFSRLKVTAESEELFTMSESCYYAWLMAAYADSEATKTLERAIELCKEAAALSDPLAIVRLGYYYDKDYVEPNSSETERCKIAYNYYTTVCYSDLPILEQGKGLRQSYDWEKIKLNAAKLMLDMLAYAPAEMHAVREYSLEYNIKEVEKRLHFTYRQSAEPLHRQRRSEQVYSMLYACTSRQRAPLFGVVRLSGAELKQLFSNSKTANLSVYAMLNKGVSLHYIKCDKDGIVDLHERFVSLSNQKYIDEQLASLGEEESLWLYFFNRGGEHRFFGSYALAKIKGALENGKFSLVRALIDGGGKKDYTFYDDDIFCFKKFATSFKNAATGLVDRVCGRD